MLGSRSMRAHWVLIAALTTACACCKNGSGGGGTGSGPGTGTGSGPGTGGSGKAEECATLQAHVEELYRAGAERTKMTPEEIADNTAMVVGGCKETPDRVVGCARAATSVAQLEACLPPLDDDGSEGLQFSNK